MEGLEKTLDSFISETEDNISDIKSDVRLADKDFTDKIDDLYCDIRNLESITSSLESDMSSVQSDIQALNSNITDLTLLK